MRRKVILHLCTILLFMTLLQGCTNIAMSGVEAVYNRHSIQKSLNDQYITMKAFKTLNIDTKLFKNTHIAVATFNGEVLLAGQVPHTWQRSKAEQLVKVIPGIKQIYNLIAIENPSSSLVRMSDTWLTAKIKAKLLASDEVEANQIKVVTENGTVYLMGILSPEAAQEAVELARSTDGVERVVKIFSYVRITKTLS